MARKIKQIEKQENHVELVDRDVTEMLNDGLPDSVPAARVRLVYNRGKRRFETTVTVSNDTNGTAGLERTKKLGVRRLLRTLRKNS